MFVSDFISILYAARDTMNAMGKNTRTDKQVMQAGN